MFPSQMDKFKRKYGSVKANSTSSLFVKNVIGAPDVDEIERWYEYIVRLLLLLLLKMFFVIFDLCSMATALYTTLIDGDKLPEQKESSEIFNEKSHPLVLSIYSSAFPVSLSLSLSLALPPSTANMSNIFFVFLVSQPRYY